jgi:DeoR/GlpR family transcriptional regulator of sugar metabolism
MNLSFSERKQAILTALDKDSRIKTSILARSLGASEITIRRDLEKLDKEGVLVKTHGGAYKNDASINEFLYIKQIREQEEEKKRIGIEAAALVSEGDVIFMDTGTTTLQIARALKNEKNITVVTNSILILSELRFVKDLEIILLGGNYRPGNFALSGPLTEKAIKNFRAKYAFIGADSINLEYGITSNDLYTAHITQLMMKHAENSILVTDYTKFSKSGSIKYASVEDFDLIITDKKLASEDFNNIKLHNIQIRRV